MEATNYTTNSDMLTLLASRVKEYRLAARMSQQELAEQSGVSQTTISHFEQGVSRNLTLANFISLLRALGQEQRLAEILPEPAAPAPSHAPHPGSLAARIAALPPAVGLQSPAWLRAFLGAHEAEITTVFFDIAGPHPMQATPADLIAALDA